MLNLTITLCVYDVPELLQGSDVIGSHSVQFVDKGEEGHVVAFHLSVHGHGLALNSSHCTQDQHCSVQHTQRSLHFDGEVHVTWRTPAER